MSETNRLGRYELQRVLGRGSQGKVHLAYDPELQRDVAIKVVTSDKAEFNQAGDNGTPLEALVSSKLRHPHIVPIHDIGKAENRPYLVFGYVEGKPMSMQLSAEGKYSVEDATVLIAGILDAVATAHAAGVLHLDLGPRNIMIDTDGKPQIMDFGLAQFVNFEREDKSLATGTLRYMAPEHFLRQELGPFTDVFAIASTFYEMITGERAMQGDTIETIQRAIVAVDVNYDRLRELPHADHLLRFFKGAFVMDYEQRYADAGKMREAFRVFVTASGLADAVRTDSPSHSTVDFLLRRMQQKKDFPAISSTLTEINRLTGDDAEGSADKLANVILRDLSLTSKLLTMANSSFYGTRATEVTSVSQAVVLLGVQQVRMVASSLTLFGHLKGDSHILRDSMTKSFLAGLLARHMAKRERIRNAEEAFIAGMCQNLGENLAIYYFAEDHEFVRDKMAQGMPRDEATCAVLGVTFAEVGAAVAEIWALPRSIIDAINGFVDDSELTPADDDMKLRNISIFANVLCNAFVGDDVENITATLELAAERYIPTTTLSSQYLFQLFQAAFEKLKQFAPVFEINVSESEFCQCVSTWVQSRALDFKDEEPEIDEGTGTISTRTARHA
ncbi:MAG: HDOD domain-containing protein [Pseudomonadota bacterium]